MADDNQVSRIFSGSAGRTAIQLVIASLIVGAILSFLGLSPREFWEGIFNTIRGLVEMIGDSIGEVAINLITYLIIGAMVVIPIWIIARVIGNQNK